MPLPGWSLDLEGGWSVHGGRRRAAGRLKKRLRGHTLIKNLYLHWLLR